MTGPPQPSDGPRMTTRYMTKYERARILGTRALQIRCCRILCGSPCSNVAATPLAMPCAGDPM